MTPQQFIEKMKQETPFPLQMTFDQYNEFLIHVENVIAETAKFILQENGDYKKINSRLLNIISACEVK